MQQTTINLRKDFFSTTLTEIVNIHGCSAELFTYETGIEAIRLKNQRGHLDILPYYGQMIWRAVFDGVDLTMQSHFEIPRPANDIVGTYGCFMYHSGLLHNGNPGENDNHPLHGEMPLAPMGSAKIETGEDNHGPWISVVSEYEYLMGFGNHYRATPRIVLRPNDATFKITLEVQNLSLDPMDLMYMCHANFAFVEGSTIVQPTRFTSADTLVRTSVPAIVKANADYLARIERLKHNPAETEFISKDLECDPEIVLYLKNMKKSEDGLIHFMLKKPEGDAFTVSYDPDEFSHLTRWILANNMQKVCAFAMPATCGVEGHYVEKQAGNVRILKGGERAQFSIRLGYLNATESLAEDALIRTSR